MLPNKIRYIKTMIRHTISGGNQSGKVMIIIVGIFLVVINGASGGNHYGK